MDIPRPDNFNETYLYEGTDFPLVLAQKLILQNSWNAISLPLFDQVNPSPMPTSNRSSTKSSAA
jgi:hypothetical protein